MTDTLKPIFASKYRPDKERPQHNEPNPILRAFRAHAAKFRTEKLAVLARVELVWLRQGQACGSEGSTLPQRDHARRVLTRLAESSR